MEAFIEACRPSERLGLFEHLRELQSLGWKSQDFWPCLDLTKIDDASRGHVEAIAMYYSQLAVNQSTSLVWCQEFVQTNASLRWKGEGSASVLSKWSQFRIASIGLEDYYQDDDAFMLGNFNWERPQLRHQVITTALNKPTLEEFQLHEVDQAYWNIEAFYDPSKRLLSLGYHDRYLNDQQGLNMDNLNNCFELFRPLLASKVSKIILRNLQPDLLQIILKGFTPLLLTTPVEILELAAWEFSITDGDALANAIRDHTTLQEVKFLLPTFPYTCATGVIAALPPSIKTFALVDTEMSLSSRYTPQECELLQTMARDRGIRL
ncbi:hypothetical protein AC1031_010565 [Aphanomyces cochlioides]|nr:hypothetical protein AC1031_010565 [Aphanomyces cochlioides]